MGRAVRILQFVGITLLLSFNTLQSSETFIFNFDQSALSIEKREGYDFVQYEALDHTQQTGAPCLPIKVVQIPLPAGSTIQSIQITGIKKSPIKGSYNIYPAQSPQIISESDYAFTGPDQTVYSSSEVYPKESVSLISTGSFSGQNIGTILICPVQYIPAQKEIIFASQIEFEIIHQNQPVLKKSDQRSPYSQKMLDQSLHCLLYQGKEKTESAETKKAQQFHPLDAHPYVIITSTELESHFQPLADWKTRKGLAAEIVTMSYITSSYSGRDDAEKVRNFIIYAYQNWGTLWVLLGGDVNIVPHRLTFAFDCEYGSYSDNYIPCDLYFSDLDGNWDANENDLFGEVDDQVDMYPDVFVGRASVENGQEADAFVQKILTYEKTKNGHETNALLLAEVFWGTPFTDGGVAKDFIDQNFIPPQFDPITKLYAVNGDENLETVMASINQGQNLINHNGHAWYTGLSADEGFFTSHEADALTNTSQYSILFSVGCWPAAIDYDCIAEHLVTNPQGGCVAFVGNSRYGWGSPGNPLYGYSDRFDQQFFRQIFEQEGHHVGSILAAAKATYVPFAQQENVYRWCEYQILLLGDPEMPVWTDEPRDLTVSHRDTLPAGKAQCRIVVQDSDEPLANAMVCLMQDEDVYQMGLTDIDGQVTFNFEAQNPTKNLQLTVTGPNFLPYEKSIPLIADFPYIHIASLSPQNSENTVVIPGDTVHADVVMKNYGTQDALNIQAVLTRLTEQIQLLTDTTRVPVISGLDSVFIEGAFSFIVDSNLENGDAVPLQFEIQDEAGHTWQDEIFVIVGTPLLSVVDFHIDDSVSGDGDGFADPGETVQIDLSLFNSGLATAQLEIPEFLLSENFTFSDGSLQNSICSANDTLLFSNNIQIDPLTIDPSFHAIIIQMRTKDDFVFYDTLMISVGALGLRDNVETGGSLWQHSGTSDLWHRVMHRKHSGHFSWYCGRSETHTYDNNMEASLVSDSFTVDINSQLSFWCWYQCPNYGSTGLYAEIHDGIMWNTLDFIGSGGALGMLPTGNEWMKYKYDLSHIPRGTECRVRFRFQGDGETATEGAYVDDIIVQNKRIPFSFSVPPVPNDPELQITDIEDKIALSWSSSSGLCESFHEKGYLLQGYNIYQVTTAQEPFINPVRIATFDLEDGIQSITETIVDPVSQSLTEWIFQSGTDLGIEHVMHVGKDYINDSYLVKGKPYHFAVTSYAFCEDSTAIPRSVESPLNPVTFIYKQNEPGYGWGDTVAVSHVRGESNALIAPIALDPSQLTGHKYYIQIDSGPSGELVWTLKDLTINQDLYNQMSVPGNVLVDGFQLLVQDVAQVNYQSITVQGEGSYYLGSHYDNDWSPTARSQDTFMEGCCTDPFKMADDYELRFTGEYENLGNGIVAVKEGTGSLATLCEARNYTLDSHPMNPDPGRDAPFLVRIPFEVWNVDDDRQINFLIYDREQMIGDTPFYALNPTKRMYSWFINTPYEEKTFSFSESDKLNLTWNLDFWSFDFVRGDIVNIEFENPLTSDDVYAFFTDADSTVNEGNIPTSFQLMQNYPNPFNASTTIRFHVPEPSHVTIKVYSILGAELETLVDGLYTTNEHNVEWQNINLPSGIYFLRMEAGGVVKTRKCIILK